MILDMLWISLGLVEEIYLWSMSSFVNFFLSAASFWVGKYAHVGYYIVYYELDV